MKRVLLAPRAILLQLHTIGMVLLVLVRRVVTTLAFRACKSDHSAHENPPRPSHIVVNMAQVKMLPSIALLCQLGILPERIPT